MLRFGLAEASMLGKPQPPAPAPAPAPTRRFTDSVDANATVIGPGTRVTGDLTSDGPVDVAGTLEGDVRVNGHCRVREGARVVGRLEAKTLVVEGEVSGPALVADKVEIGATARIESNIQARVVAMADGAFLEGEVRMDAAGGAGPPHTFTEKRKGTDVAASR
jgi:cytoskeletal protein CcmA (bactofilin family)